MPKSPADMWNAIIQNLPQKTGKTLEEWVGVLDDCPHAKRKERIGWLQETFGLGHGQAQVIVDEAALPADFVPPSDAELLEAQYAGGKTVLRPIYDAVIAAVRTLGSDVSVEARKTYVSLSRGRQFALVQAATRTTVVVGLVLPAGTASPRLSEAGSFGSGSITHKLTLTSVDEVDDQLRGWLREAYDAVAPAP
jgi:hypothetical protein